MANHHQLNSTALNGPTIRGANALLIGGVLSVGLMVSSITVGAVLSGGMHTTPEAGGRISQHLSGGIRSHTHTVGGIQYITAALQHGIHSNGAVSANLGVAEGLNGGLYSGSGWGGQRVASARLQMPDTIGDAAQVGGTIHADAMLSQGIASTSYVSANIIGSTVLFADGVRSNSRLDSEDIRTGRYLTGGLDPSSSEFSGSLVTLQIYLSGGLLSLHDLGYEIDASAMLQGGAVQVGALDSPVMRVGAALNNGIARLSTLDAKIIISPASNGGVDSGNVLDAALVSDAVIHGGLDSSSLLDSRNMVAAQTLVGGAYDTSALDAAITLDAMLQGALESDAALDSGIRADARLGDGTSSTNALNSSLSTNILLSDGIASPSSIDGELNTWIFLTGGINHPTESFDARLRTDIPLRGGFTSTSVTGGEVWQAFDDPFHNTWALNIRSATVELHIFTPTEDI